MIWLVFALLTGAAAFSILYPLAQARADLATASPDVAFYKAQVAALAQDQAAGLMSAADAQLALAEAGRRLLQAQTQPTSSASSNTRARRITSALALVFVPVFALSLYMALGNPDLPDLPLDARPQASADAMDMATAIAKIEAHLAQDPNDGQGWDVLGPIYLQQGRFAEAAKAFTNAARVLGETAARESSIGQAWVNAAQGQVTPDARAAFEAAIRLDPQAVAPRFYLGVAAQQAGDIPRAKAIWSALLASAPPDAPWVGPLAAQLKALEAPAQSPTLKVTP